MGDVGSEAHDVVWRSGADQQTRVGNEFVVATGPCLVHSSDGI
jgi:hypothetical protein